MTYTLDSSAIIALLGQESGHQIVEKALATTPKPFIHAINFLEVDYILKKTHPKKIYQDLRKILESFPLTVAELFTPEITDYARYLKTKHKLSIADSIGLALSRFMDTTFLTSDRHELEIIAKNEPHLKIEFLR